MHHHMTEFSNQSKNKTINQFFCFVFFFNSFETFLLFLETEEVKDVIRQGTTFEN